MKSKSLIAFLFTFFLVGLAVAFSPQSDINLLDTYNITNGSAASFDTLTVSESINLNGADINLSNFTASADTTIAKWPLNDTDINNQSGSLAVNHTTFEEEAHCSEHDGDGLGCLVEALYIKVSNGIELAADTLQIDISWFTDRFLNKTDSATAISLVNSSNLLINWSGIGDTDTTYNADEVSIYESANVFYLNESRNNATIIAITDARDTDTDTLWPINGTVLENQTGTLGIVKSFFDTAYLDNVDTTYNSDEVGIYESANVFYLNETRNNATIIAITDARDADTTYACSDWAACSDDSLWDADKLDGHDTAYFQIALTDEASLYTALSDVIQFYELGDKVGDADTLDTHDTAYFQIDLTDEASLYTSLSDVSEFLETADDAKLNSLNASGTIINSTGIYFLG